MMNKTQFPEIPHPDDPEWDEKIKKCLDWLIRWPERLQKQMDELSEKDDEQ